MAATPPTILIKWRRLIGFALGPRQQPTTSLMQRGDIASRQNSVPTSATGHGLPSRMHQCHGRYTPDSRRLTTAPKLAVLGQKRLWLGSRPAPNQIPRKCKNANYTANGDNAHYAAPSLVDRNNLHQLFWRQCISEHWSAELSSEPRSLELKAKLHVGEPTSDFSERLVEGKDPPVPTRHAKQHHSE